MANQSLQQHETKIAAESPASAMMALIERAATSQEIDIDKLDRLLETKERWEAGEARKSFGRAMARFRSNVDPIRKTRKAHNSAYAGLAESISEIKSELSACGLSVSWRTEQSESLIRVTCVVSHVDGHHEQTTLAASPDTSGSKNSIQAIGSTVTYLERYTMYAILGLASTDQDDDGARASGGKVSDDQLANIISLMDELGKKLNRESFANWLKDKIGAHEGKVENVPAASYKSVIAQLERKRNE